MSFRYPSHVARPGLRMGLLVALIVSTPAYALKEDRDQPLQINAASVEVNEKSGVAVYRGNVVLVQGSLRIEADRLDVRSGARRANTITDTGRPVRIRGMLENSADEFRAQAERLVYTTAVRELEMTGKVWLRQEGNEFHAQQLHYEIDNRRLTANGAGAGTGDGRVHAVIQPRTPSNTDERAQDNIKEKTP